MGRTWGQVCALLLLVTSSAFLCAQDPHLAGDPAAPLYRASPFAHGYMHGYEDGFHQGTVELLSQMPDAKKTKALDGHKAYKHEFGDRDEFLQGYAAGFVEGRGDASEHGFRAYERMAAVARDLKAYDKGAAAHFEQGLESGYLTQRSGQAVESASCAASEAAQHAAFCDGLRRGELLAGGDATSASAVASAGEAKVAVPTPAAADPKPATVAVPLIGGGEAPPQSLPF